MRIPQRMPRAGKLFSSGLHGSATSMGLLVLRVVVGVALILHGLPKMSAPTAWMGPDSPYPGSLQAAAAFSEVVGGALLAIGLLTRVAALFVAGTMAVATYTLIAKGMPFVPTSSGQGAWELPATYFATALLLVVAGAGRFSVDRIVHSPLRGAI